MFISIIPAWSLFQFSIILPGNDCSLIILSTVGVSARPRGAELPPGMHSGFLVVDGPFSRFFFLLIFQGLSSASVSIGVANLISNLIVIHKML